MSMQHTIREAITDGVITAKVRGALSDDSITACYDIRVETLSGVVELSGFVGSDVVRVEALQVTQHVPGVRRVQDLLDVRDCLG
jgi:hyperosmotically inducible periplasmic protein